MCGQACITHTNPSVTHLLSSTPDHWRGTKATVTVKQDPAYMVRAQQRRHRIKYGGWLGSERTPEGYPGDIIGVRKE